MSFPKIDSPCPLRVSALPEPGRDFCTRCERRVHNLDRMTAPERRGFLAACEGPICVAYTRRVPRAVGAALVAAGVAAALNAAPAAAEEPAAPQAAPIPPASDSAHYMDLLLRPPRVEVMQIEDAPMVITVGSVLDPAGARWDDADSHHATLPEIPRGTASALLDEGAVEFVAAPSTVKR